jgi:hypothetical protein
MTSANRLAECVKPVVEQLEGRTMMSITVHPLSQDSDGHQRLVISGDSKNDTLFVTDDPVNLEVRIVKNGTPLTVAYPGGTPIELFDIDLGGGNDRIEFEVYGDAITPTYVGEQRSISLDGDTGNDTIIATIPGGIIGGSDIAVDVDGDSGNDNITLNFTYLRDSKLDVDLKDGEGNDTSLVNLPGLLSTDGFASPNYNSTLFFDANQGNGKNTLTVNAATGIYYDSLVDIDIKGGNSTGGSFDTVNLDFTNSVVEGKLFVVVNTLNGDDKINTLMDGLYVESFNTPSYATAPTALFTLNGNDGKDVITTAATTSGFYVDETALLSFAVKGGNGDDKINTNFTGPINVEVGGQMVLNLDGQNNNDTISTQLFFGDKTGSGTGGFGGGQITLQIMGGQNSDTINLLATDLSTSGILFAPGAFGMVLDGQTGTDKANVQVVNLLTPPLIRNFEQQNVIILP